MFPIEYRCFILSHLLVSYESSKLYLYEQHKKIIKMKIKIKPIILEDKQAQHLPHLQYNNKWKILLAIGALLVIVGLYMILKENIVLSTVGLVLIIYSSIDIISYILYPKNKDIIK